MALSWTKTETGHQASTDHGVYRIEKKGSRFSLTYQGKPGPFPQAFEARTTLTVARQEAEKHHASFEPEDPKPPTDPLPMPPSKPLDEPLPPLPPPGGGKPADPKPTPTEKDVKFERAVRNLLRLASYDEVPVVSLTTNRPVSRFLPALV